MNYSTNYSMREPVPAEKVKVADINYNTEIIDGVMLDNRQISIDMYDDTSTYNTDDLAGHENSSGRIAVYRCLQDNTTGAWDDTKWVQTNLADEITDIRGNAGASDLGDLNDVDLTNPTEGQVLTYDDQNDEWVNSDLPDADVTKTASGNPIEFSDGADAPLVKCVTQITGSQDLHGYDKPWVGGAGKNKFDSTLMVNPASSAKWVQVTLKANTAYTVSSDIPNSYISAYIFAIAGTDTSSATSGTNGVGSGRPQYITTGEDGIISFAYRTNGASGVLDLNNYVYQIEEGSTATTFAPYSNICPITAYTEGEIEVRGVNLWNGEWEEGDIDATTGQDISGSGVWRTKGYISIIPSTQCFVATDGVTGASIRPRFYDSNKNYIGTVTALTGSAFNTPNNAMYLRFAPNSSIVPNKTIGVNYPSTYTTYEPYTSTTHTTTYQSSIYRGSEDVVNGEVTELTHKLTFTGDVSEGWSVNTSDNKSVFYISVPTKYRVQQNFICNEFYSRNVLAYFELNNNEIALSMMFEYINIRHDEITTVEAWRTFLANNNLEVTLTIATPTTTSVSPTNLPIKSLSGYNHIESSTGDMEIEYFPAKEQPLIDLIQSSQHVYSTQEQVVGKWVDGKDVYEKTYVFSSLPSVNDWTAFDEDCGIDTLVDYSLMFTRSNGQIDNDSDELRVAYNPPTGLGDLCYYPGGVEATHITVRYTKTSSNNRSLAKSAPQEETKEEQVEELKEEQTEEIKEEPEEVKEEPVEEVKEEVKEEETKEEGEVNER